MSSDSPQKPKKLSAVEGFKAESNYLRGEIAEELLNEKPDFGKGSIQLLKHHGTYQQDDRDQRMANRAAGIKDKAYTMMLRTALPGGKLSSQQMLELIALGDELGIGNIKLTTRQAIQHHGILKSDLKETIARINKAQMSTLAACGDVNRNVMCCPAPYKSPMHIESQKFADDVAAAFLPRTKAYYELWLKDTETGEKELVGGGAEQIEPLYGKNYLPRKFKTAIAFPHDNCVDIYTNDLGYLAIVEDEKIIGYNILVGGGMGTTPAQKKTFPALAKKLCFATPEEAIKIGEAVIKVQRDFGNREDRKIARMKYLIAEWGIEKFRDKVAEYYGSPLTESNPADVHGMNAHLGWEEQGDGNWFYGLNIENGRVIDDDTKQLKSAIIEICKTIQPEMRVTAQQSLIFADIEPEQKSELESILVKHKVKRSEEYTKLRTWSMACVAWPTCGLAITESERALPAVMDEIEKEFAALGMEPEEITVRMTGCPNGCARPYNADIGLVGKAKDAYTIYLGGRWLGNRLAWVYLDRVSRDELVPQLAKVFKLYAEDKTDDETFGDFCDRFGKETLLEKTGNAP